MERESKPLTEGNPQSRPTFLSLRRRLELAWGLLALGAVVTFLGLLTVDLGLDQPIPVLGGFAFLSPTVAGGVGTIAVGFLLVFLGAALRGLSRDWRDIASNLPSTPPRPEGMPPMRRCPNCGVHTWLNVCPECGCNLAVSPTQ